MKKIHYLALLLFSVINANAQVIDFQDVNFKNTLLVSSPSNFIAKNSNGEFFSIDANGNSEIEVTEALEVSYLNVSYANITSVAECSYFQNLKLFYCYSNPLTSIDISSLSLLEEFYTGANMIDSIDFTGLNNLKKILLNITNINHLQISNLPQLEYVDCSGVGTFGPSIITLSNLPNLNYFNCGLNNLTSINLDNLPLFETLNCSDNQLTSLNVTNFTNLKNLYCAKNQLTELNLTGLSLLQYLDCYDNQLSGLDLTNNSSIKNLYCWNNQLETLLIENCTSLELVYAESNLLSTIALTNLINLRHLSLYFNNLDELEVNNLLNLEVLTCYGNNLTSLNVENLSHLTTLYCDDNNLQFLNIKNNWEGDFFYVTFGGNNNLMHVCCNDKDLNQIQLSASNAGYTNLVINSYCSFSPGGNYYAIEGNSKLDSNLNGCNSDDINFPFMNFSITNGIESGNIISDASGNYYITVSEGIHTVTPIFENPSYFSMTPSSFTADFPVQGEIVNQNFCITPNANHNDLEVIIIPVLPARPGFDATYKIVYKNKGTTTLSGAVTFEFEDSKMDFVTSIPISSSQATGLLTYDYTNLQPFETRIINLTFNVNSPMESPAVNIGDQLNFTAIINPLVDDETEEDNTSSLKQVVVGSYDPNDKTCSEGTVVGPEMIGEYVHYVIRFENTGTFPAENIVVKDMIDLTKFDLSTLIPTSSSHSFVTRIAADGKVEFIFENIQLPFDDANNDGYVAFKIKTLPSLAVGDTFSNKANIYFDYNFPIETNTATTAIQVLGNSDFDLSDYMTLYPNPVKNELNIKVNNTISITSINIYNSLGQLVLVATNPSESIDVSDLKTGSYFIKVISDKGISNGKFIKE
ncbi:MAG: T9SS type A sorting domain-containing protein [Flavobacteriales bacterium]|nr:T9SS type A sorting domain-containing protein [Flavobacteriales bacterium]